MNGKNIELGNDQVVNPMTVKTIKGEGMTIYNEDPLAELKGTAKKGDLFVKYEIEFPTCMPQWKKDQIVEILIE